MTSPSASRTASPDGLDDGTVALRDHITLLTGYPFKSEFYTEQPDGVRLVRGDNVVQGQLRWDNVKRWPLNRIDEARGYELCEGDVVLAMDRPWIEAGLKYARIGPDDVPSFLVQRVACLRAKDGLDQGYLFYLIGSHRFTDHVLSIQTGTAVPHISGPQILQFRYRPLPLDRQRAIAAVLGSLDDKIEQNRRAARALERLARAIFRAWFVDFEPVKAKAAGAASFPSMPQAAFDALPTTFIDSELGPVPEGWHVGSIDSIAVFHNSKRVPLSGREREARTGCFRYFGAAGVIDYVDDYLFEGVFVLVGEDGTVVTEGDRPMVQYCWGKFWVNNHAHVLSGRHELIPEHVKLVLEHVNIRPYVTGAVQPKLNQGNLKSVPVVLADPSVNSAFALKISPLYSKFRQIHDEINALVSFRDYLLPQLLSGQVPVEVGNA